jgi:hypothetical protein
MSGVERSEVLKTVEALGLMSEITHWMFCGKNNT